MDIISLMQPPRNLWVALWGSISILAWMPSGSNSIPAIPAWIPYGCPQVFSRVLPQMLLVNQNHSEKQKKNHLPNFLRGIRPSLRPVSLLETLVEWLVRRLMGKLSFWRRQFGAENHSTASLFTTMVVWWRV